MVKSDSVMIEKEKLESLDQKDQFRLIQEIRQYIITYPEARINHAHSLFHFLESPFTIICRGSMLALTDIFISIIPLYKIEKEELDKKLGRSM